jgi:type IV pilus biogenesis protein PilP
MKVHPLFAVVCVCSAAGVVAWDVRWFAKSHGEAVTTTPEPATSDPSGDSTASNGASSPTAAPSDRSPGTGDVGNDDDPAPKNGGDAPKKSGDVDFNALFEKMLAQSRSQPAVRSTTDEGARAFAKVDPNTPVAAPTPPAADEAARSEQTWSKLELRGVVFGQGRALALVNGRVLREGDELPGTRYAIEKILADRVVVALPGGSTRALTLAAAPSPAASSGSGASASSGSSGSHGSSGSSHAASSPPAPSAPTNGAAAPQNGNAGTNGTSGSTSGSSTSGAHG